MRTEKRIIVTIPILYSDDDLFVIDKPAGIVVNRAESVRGFTVQDWAEKNIQKIKRSKDQKKKNTDLQLFIDRSGIVHRLDKDTSGVLLVAKHPTALVNLLTQFKERTIRKEYRALVHGRVVPREGSIDVPVQRLPWDRKRFGVWPDGKPSQTHYRVKDYFHSPEGIYTLLDVRPRTGRTHQIRVHLRYLGYPIVGDLFYAGKKRARDTHGWCPRIFLHAAKLTFKLPSSGKMITIKSPLPPELQQTLNRMTVAE